MAKSIAANSSLKTIKSAKGSQIQQRQKETKRKIGSNKESGSTSRTAKSPASTPPPDFDPASASYNLSLPAKLSDKSCHCNANDKVAPNKDASLKAETDKQTAERNAAKAQVRKYFLLVIIVLAMLSLVLIIAIVAINLSMKPDPYERTVDPGSRRNRTTTRHVNYSTAGNITTVKRGNWSTTSTTYHVKINTSVPGKVSTTTTSTTTRRSTTRRKLPG